MGQHAVGVAPENSALRSRVAAAVRGWQVGIMVVVEILLWLLPAVVVTCAAMAWVSWIGRDRPERERSEVEQERFARAVMRPMPDERRGPRQRERSTGVAVRRDADQGRRSA